MDALGVDRPAAVVRGGGSPLLHAVVTELVDQGYDVHLPVLGDPGDPSRRHPRLHPVPVEPDAAGVPDAALRRSLRQRPSPLALLVTDDAHDLFAELRLVHAQMGPLHDAAVLVLGPPLPGGTRAHLQAAGLPVSVTTLSPGGRRPAGLLGPGATARRGVAAARRGIPHLACGRGAIHADPAVALPPGTADPAPLDRAAPSRRLRPRR